MPNEIDEHVGKRLRRRRRLLGLTQQQVAEAVGIKFQQIQKYESGANRVAASRLFEIAEALDVPVQYFYEGIEREGKPTSKAFGDAAISPDVLSEKETLDLVRAYYKLNERPRRRILELARSLDPETRGKDGGPAGGDEPS